MTQAQQIASMYHDDGQCWWIDEGEDQIEIGEMCIRHGARREQDFTRGDRCRYVWDDGSVLTMAGDGWDYGHRACWCWEGAGHDEECEADDA